ncbi:MAG: aminotransferase class I/II-fold pyridoxal phosphate-dependent enzyme [Chitinophagaceae bacterium]|nr:aminotransferase class I/II-fold pyridoxal phosphate-dependent enzyme [Chitinophagaceae bacterium]
MRKLSALAESLVGSEIVRLGNAISERVKKGEHIYNYTIGDFNPKIFPIPSELERLIIQAYKDHHTNYPAGNGIYELREAVSYFLRKRLNLEYSVDEIQIASGGRPLIYTVFKTIVDDNDKVIYAAPSWNNNHYTHLTNAQHCVINCFPENNFMPTAIDIAPHIEGATLLCLCTPQNPTGTVFSKEGLTAICDLVIAENKRRGDDEKKLYVMFDQMYWTLTYGSTEHYNPVSLRPEMRDYTIFISGISKCFSATGVRVGWAMAPTEIINKMRALLSHIGAWAPMAEQKATAQYLYNDADIDNYFIGFKAALEMRLNKIYNCIIALKEQGYNVDAISPQAAIYLTIKIDLVGKTTSSGKLLEKQLDVTEYLLNEAKLAIVPFSAFGANADSAWYRLSVGVVQLNDIEKVMQLLEAALEKLN